jgi:transposase-like protein
MSGARRISSGGTRVRISQDEVSDHLRQIVRGTIEDALNALIEAKAHRQGGAAQGIRGRTQKPVRPVSARAVARNVGPVRLKVPQLRQTPLAAAILDSFKQNENFIEQALVEMYVTRITKQRILDVAAALLGPLVTRHELKNCGYRIHANLDGRRKALIDCRDHSLAIELVEIQSFWDATGARTKLLVASALSVRGKRQVLAMRAITRNREADVRKLIQNLAIRGLRDFRMLQ